MNNVKKRMRNIYLKEATGESGDVDYYSLEGRYALYEWSKKQCWWNKAIFHNHIQHNKCFADAIHDLLKELNG